MPQVSHGEADAVSCGAEPTAVTSLLSSLTFGTVGGRTRFRKRAVGRSCTELQAAGKHVVWRHLTYHSLRFLPGLLYKEIPAEPPGRDLETLPEPAAGMCGQTPAAPSSPGTSSLNDNHPNLPAPLAHLLPPPPEHPP